jgi:hypothetical protein
VSFGAINEFLDLMQVTRLIQEIDLLLLAQLFALLLSVHVLHPLRLLLLLVLVVLGDSLVKEVALKLDFLLEVIAWNVQIRNLLL